MTVLAIILFVVGFGILRYGRSMDQTIERPGTDGYSIVYYFRDGADADLVRLHSTTVSIGWAVIGFSVGILVISSL